MQARLWRRCLGAVAVACLVAAGPVGPVGPVRGVRPAVAQTAAILAEQERLRDEERAKAAEVDALTADADAVDAAITALDADVAHQRARAEDAEAAVRAVQAELVTARAQQADAEDAVAALRAELQQAALAAYVRPPSESLAVVLADEDPSAGAKRTALAAAHSRSVADVIDAMRAATERARRAGVRATAALAAAEAASAAEQRALAGLDESLAVQQTLADGVHARLDRALGEAAAISARSQELADRLTARNTQLASRVGPSSGGSRPSWTSAGVRVTTVRGIEVNVLIADDVAALIDDAAADGISLSGSGYRDISTQIELRMQHCGTSEYAIWEMSSMECSPPVARPGFSMHEQGLAVDFVVGGDLIRSRSSRAYQWLAANASAYGLYNLPSEPWHWSTTGS